jgi:hypothetical protein
MTDDAEITLEANRSPLLQGAYWLITAAIALFDGSFVGSDPPLDLVVRERPSGRIVYRKQSLHGAEAESEAQEAARVIRVMGVQGYVDRESA